MNDLQKVICGALACAVAVITIMCLVFNESDAEMAERRSKECAKEGYDGIALKYTKEGDKYFVCVNYDE